MAEAAVKPEIKIDAADNDVNLADVEQYEEDTDLAFPPAGSQAWFAKIPNDLWAAWNEVYEKAPENTRMQLGVMRVYDGDAAHTDPREQKVEMLLREDITETKRLPKKYTLKMQATGYNNTVVFSEKNLPGHSTRAYGRSRFLNQSNKAGINKSDRYNKKPGDYASSIPKQTALAAPIQVEATVSAQIDPADFFQGMNGAMQIPTTNLTTFQPLAAKRLGNHNVFSSFTTSSKPSKGKKKPKEKAVRMDQQQMYDAIYRCFGRYKYWKLGAFRRELRQPEAFIKSTLENIANLIRTGDFAGCYMLKPEYASMQQIDQSKVKDEVVDSAAEDGTDGPTGDEMDEDDLGDLEDVKMEGDGT